MAFQPIKYHSGRALDLPIAGSTTISKFEHCKMDSGGHLTSGTSGDDEAEYIALETIDNSGGSDGDDEVLVLPVDGIVQFIADSSASVSRSSHVGTDIDFNGKNDLDPGATTDKVFHVDDIYDSSNDLFLGRFNAPSL